MVRRGSLRSSLGLTLSALELLSSLSMRLSAKIVDLELKIKQEGHQCVISK